MVSLTAQEEYRRLCCSECGIVYFFPESWTARASESGKQWKCPNGHNQWFGESGYDKLRRERDLLAQRIAQRDDEVNRQRELREAAERSASAARGQLTKLKNRTANGVCPCCTRSFVNLRRHIETKHPDFGAIKEISNGD